MSAAALGAFLLLYASIIQQQQQQQQKRMPNVSIPFGVCAMCVRI